MHETQTHAIATTIHGRVLARPAAGRPAGILVGFHGYMENAAIQMERLRTIPGTGAWTLVAIQALHRFYKGRSQEVVASWMTRQDRDAAIADNVAYVDAAIDAVAPGPGTAIVPIVWCGFSQGAAMAFRAAALGKHRAAGVIAVGGDVPPELTRDPGARFPGVLLVRGARDEWYTQDKLDMDLAALGPRAAAVRPLVVDAGHEWTPEVSRAAGELLASLPA